MKDHRYDAVTGATDRSLALFETALAELNCYVGDPLATVDEALADSPAFAMAHALRAYLLLAGMEKDLLPEAAVTADRLRRLPALNEREQGHAGAVASFVRGDWGEASRSLDDVLAANPRDLLALQVGHLLDFYRGESTLLRDRVARVRPAWSADLPGYHAVLGMHAFGLEECGAYALAEEAGRRAVALEPGDGWAHHAVAHVMEMTGRAEEGAAWLEGGAEAWAPRSFFAVHNWWHLALFHLERDDVAGALALYDGAVRGGQSGVVLEMIDASALLWRLSLRGAEVGDRWQALADHWTPRLRDGLYAFNDAHAMMALLGAERLDDAYRLLAAMHGASLVPSENGGMTREVGLPLAQALVDFHHGRNEAVVEALLPLRLIASRFGGSHAQRDLLDLTLIEAAERAGNRSLVRSLARERLSRKPDSPLARRYARRSDAVGDVAAA